MKVYCPCTINSNFSYATDTILCPLCHTHQHRNCITPCDEMETYVCPSCQLLNTELPMKRIRNVLPPMLFDSNQLKKEKKVSFAFTPDFSFFPSKTGNRPNYLAIRCLKLTKTGFTLSLPLTCQVVINDKKVYKNQNVNENMLVKPILLWLKEIPLTQIKSYPYNKKPLLIKNYIKDKQENFLTLTIEESSKDFSKYIISIDYVDYQLRVEDIAKDVLRLLNPIDIKLRLTRRCELPYKSKVSILDNYTESLDIKLPIRGFNCLHLEVFDLYKFINLNRDCLNYRCPICNKKSNLFYIDMYMKDLIDKYYKEKKKFISFDENLSVIENDDEEAQDSNMMDIDDDGDIDNGDDEDKVPNGLGAYNDEINEVSHISEEAINEEVIPISDDSEGSQKEIEVEKMMMNDVKEEESNEEHSTSDITLVDKYAIYIERYKKVIDKADLIYRNEILSIIHDNNNNE